MSKRDFISGSILEFKLPLDLGYAYCKIFDFRNVSSPISGPFVIRVFKFLVIPGKRIFCTQPVAHFQASHGVLNSCNPLASPWPFVSLPECYKTNRHPTIPFLVNHYFFQQRQNQVHKSENLILRNDFDKLFSLHN